jgi:hypothetical protein
MSWFRISEAALSGTLHPSFSAWTSLESFRVCKWRRRARGPLLRFGALTASVRTHGRRWRGHGAAGQTQRHAPPIIRRVETPGLHCAHMPPRPPLRRGLLTTAVRAQDIGPSLVSGTLDEAHGNWALRQLHIRDSHLSGTLPPALARWPIEQIWMANLQMAGRINDFTTWTNLSILSVEKTRLSGQLSADLTSWTKLEQLLMPDTQISGTISPSLASAWSRVRVISLSSTRVSGTIDPVRMPRAGITC